MITLKLERLLKHAVHAIPFYEGIPPVINAFPIINKNIIRDNQDAFIDMYLDKKQLISEFTSGTTGEPFICYKSINDKLALSRSLLRHRKEYSNDLKFDDKMLRFFPGFKQKKRIVKNELFLSYLCFNKYTIYEYMEDIVSFNPNIVFTTPSALVNFIKIIEECHLRDYFLSNTHIKYVEVTGEILSEEMENYIRAFFPCPVVSHYGCREIWQIAFKCSLGHYHICNDNVFIEIVDENGNIVPNGTYGNIVITGLNNYAMPIIRYAIGDSGAIGTDICLCGNNSPILHLLNGRIHEDIEIHGIKVGAVLFHQIFRNLYYNGYKGILKYQIAAKKDTITFLLTVSDSYEHIVEEHIKQSITKIFGSINIEFQYTYNIDLDNSGKGRLFIKNNNK